MESRRNVPQLSTRHDDDDDDDMSRTNPLLIDGWLQAQVMCVNVSVCMCADFDAPSRFGWADESSLTPHPPFISWS